LLVWAAGCMNKRMFIAQSALYVNTNTFTCFHRLNVAASASH
jgi:hypothetical protein